MKNGFDIFFNYCKYQKKLAQNTLRQYKQAYDRFTQVIPADIPLSYVDETAIDKFINYLKSNSVDIRNTSINVYLRGLRAFFYYFMKRGENYIKPFSIHQLPERRMSKVIYTDEELLLLLKKPNIKKCSFIEYRNWVMINFLLSCGVRLRTLINIKIKDLHLDENYIFLHRVKNNIPYHVPISTQLCFILKEYLSIRNVASVDDFLFPNAYNKQLSERGLYSTLKHYNLKRGVYKTSVQLYRHTFARKYTKNGGYIQNLQVLMGHSKIETTRIYTEPALDDLRENIDNLNPLDKLVNDTYGKKISMKK